MAQESIKERTLRTKKVISRLKKAYPDATCALEHRNALELLVATILSAQSTDTTVNQITKKLFNRYRTADDYANADPAQFEREIHSTGFFRQKTKSILAMAKTLVDEHGGEVPDTMEELTALPGVARKTANVVLGTWFSKNEGVVVDTHVGRLSHRLGLTWRSKNEKDAVRIEKDLQEIVPRRQWTFFGHALIWHGRKICTARKPMCGACTLAPLCPSASQFEATPPGAPRRQRAGAAARKAAVARR